MSNLDVKIRREKSYPHCGRLIVLESLDSQKPLQPFDLENNFSLDFPAMPETIELARQTDYKVISNMVVPDGVHQYRFTSPLQIPFSFSLHSMDDEYCPDGPLTLLRVAARLHSLVLPFGESNTVTVSVANDSPLADGRPQQGTKSPGTEASVQAKSQEPDDPTFRAAENAKFDPPVTCRLELMFTKEAEPGIVCTGYVKDVRVVLKGPWLRGPERSFNLPTSGEFSFTFIHRPAHYNSFSRQNGISGGGQAQAFAEYVLRKFYNTRELGGTGDYRGFQKT
jgi:hypothetical protein